MSTVDMGGCVLRAALYVVLVILILACAFATVVNLHGGDWENL